MAEFRKIDIVVNNAGTCTLREIVATSEQVWDETLDTNLRRIATAEDFAGSVLFLPSDLANHITGAAINVNGGSVLS